VDVDGRQRRESDGQLLADSLQLSLEMLKGVVVGWRICMVVLWKWVHLGLVQSRFRDNKDRILGCASLTF
jgi:hypothetical protein